MISRTSMFKASRALAGSTVIAAMLALACASAAGAEKLTAIVQGVTAPSLKLKAYDILAAGTRIVLQPGESIDIGYFQSCQVEHIIGGTIVINEEESWVVDGTLERHKVDCTNGGAVMQGAEMDAAVVVVRNTGMGKERVVGDPRPFIMAPGLKGSVAASIRRLDASDPAITVQLVDGAADMTYSGATLVPGGAYEITAGDRSAKFSVAPKPGKDLGEVLTRVLLF